MLDQLPEDDRLVVSARHEDGVRVKLDLDDLVLVLPQHADHLVLEQDPRLTPRLLAHLGWVSDVPDASSEVLVAAGAQPVAVGCPVDTGDQLLVLFDLMRQLQFIRRLRMHLRDVGRQAHEQIRRTSASSVLFEDVLLADLDDGPDEDEAILADSRELVTLRIELTEPDLLFVATERDHAGGRQHGLRALVVLEKRELAMVAVHVVILTLINLPINRLRQKCLKAVRHEHRVFGQVLVQPL